MSKKVDWGCGNDSKDGFVGVNYPETEEAELEHDITEFPHPFEDDEVEEIYCDNVLEHFYPEEIQEIMREWSRTCMEGAIVEIRVPHYLNKNAHTLNHKTRFSEAFWNCITPSHEYPVDDLKQVFEVVDIDFVWRDQKIVFLMKMFMPNQWVRTFFANTVDEIIFKLKKTSSSEEL